MIRVLLVEDDTARATVVRVNLVRGDPPEFSVETAQRLGAALKLLDGSAFDLVLTDLTLPDSAGLGTFHAIHSRAPDLPVVILSAVGDEELVLGSVSEGAQDYIVKGALDPEYLARTLRYAIVRHAELGSRSTGTGGSGAPDREETREGSLPLILHIAERADDRSLVEDLLKSEALDLLQVNDHEEGVSKAQTAHPTVVLLALGLGSAQASEVLRSLKEDPSTRSIPVIVTVDYFTPRGLEELEAAGAAGHLSKPIDRMKLLKELDPFVEPAHP